ncbi:hypothetical protein Amsp01_077600 [Amycolatopsis sp. NBRC 101858]|uniref:hypothetical protein n=1 Tax=Amycolatopsis sp. NBRC 101858 TaxID=3032200 RepID=UPI0024A55D20|nr:hypothetical protein [Amycolatopsis sp. NBRC 101858]GLY41737.1 hypothetical protein Amsp01_077600 [Amycolatopsis sp. NBRC 101858]
MARSHHKAAETVDDDPTAIDLEPRIEHPAPRPFMPAYPTFDVNLLRILFENLDEPWHDEQQRFMLQRYRGMRRFWISMEALFTSAIVVLSTAGIFSVFLLATGGFTLSTAVVVIIVFLVASLLVLTYVAFWWPISGARPRYFRASGITGRALLWNAKTTKLRFIDISLAYRNLGMTARALFATLQRSRWTWVSPPAASTRVLRLTRSLLDVELRDDFGLPSPANLREQRDLGRFVIDVASVVALGREDLIPRVRALYVDSLPGREPSETDEERDALFLDPMRTRTRWEVVKDFAVPMSALTVSLLSLVVALSR